MTKLDRLDFTKLYFHIGRLKAVSADKTKLLKEIDNLQETLDTILGYKSKVITCPSCKKPVTDKMNEYMIDEVGECLQCNHVREEIIW